MDGQQVTLSFRVTDDGTLEVLDQGSRKFGELGDSAEKAGERGSGAFSRWEAHLISFNQSVELAHKAWDTFESVFKPLEQADQLGKLSQSIGISVRDLTQYSVSARLADVEMSDFARGMGQFNRHIAENSQLFRVLGI